MATGYHAARLSVNAAPRYSGVPIVDVDDEPRGQAERLQGAKEATK